MAPHQDDGKKDIYNFCLKKTQKAFNELVGTTWKIQNALAIVVHISKSHIEILNDYANTACVENCNGEWFLRAKKVLKSNSINLYVYAKAIRQCLKNVRQKQNNIMLVGPTNCRKSFLLGLLELHEPISYILHGSNWRDAKLSILMIFVKHRNA